MTTLKAKISVEAERYFGQYRNPMKSAETLVGVTQIDEHFKAGSLFGAKAVLEELRNIRVFLDKEVTMHYHTDLFECPACEAKTKFDQLTKELSGEEP